MHLAAGEVEAYTVDLVEIGSGDSDETRAVWVVDRVDRAILIDAGLTGIETIALQLFQLGVFVVAAGALPLDHVGVFGRLAVDRPGLAVIVRRRLARLVVDVREDLEAEVLVLVKHLEPERRLFAAGRGHEVLVLKQALEVLAHGLAP